MAYADNAGRRSSGDEWSEDRLLMKQERWKHETKEAASSSHRRLVAVLVFLLLISSLGNVVLLAKIASIPRPISDYAQLSWNIPTPFEFETKYNSKNHSVADQAWDEVSAIAGIVAISHDEAHHLSLPDTQPFPWDSQKGIYLVNGFHNLHCLQRIRVSVARYRDELPVGDDIRHAWHCIEALRQDILCNADDTPRYTGLDQPVMSTGLGQLRLCRDWNKLQAWADARSGCWNEHEDAQIEDELERYTSCPKGSPYWPQIHHWFPNAKEPAE